MKVGRSGVANVDPSEKTALCRQNPCPGFGSASLQDPIPGNGTRQVGRHHDFL